jgi:hypothetical protein
MIWTSNDNPAYLRAVYEIETTRADIARMELELMRLNENRASVYAQIELIESNLDYIHKYAKVVGLREYSNLKAILKHETSAFVYAKNQILHVEKVLESFKDGLTRLQSRLPSFQTKVLEFKRDE